MAVLVAAAWAVGYLFDRGRDEAIKSRALEQLRLHGIRAADEVVLAINQARRDARFLAGTPPIQGIRRALEGRGLDPLGGSSLAQWEDQLAQIFLALSETRPEYFELRLSAVADAGADLLRFERDGTGMRVIAGSALAAGPELGLPAEGSALDPLELEASPGNPTAEGGKAGVLGRPVFHAVAPVKGPAEEPFARLVLGLELAPVLERAADTVGDALASVYIAGEGGDFLLHPDLERTLAHPGETPLSVADVFPVYAERILGTLPELGAFLELEGPAGAELAYVTARSLDPGHPSRRFIIIVSEPAAAFLQLADELQRQSLLAVGALLSVAAILVVVTVRRLTASLTALAGASARIGEGKYSVVLPVPEVGEVGSLVHAFRHMAAEVQRREEALNELNRDLERRVVERSAELARQHALQDLILDSIADGVVVADREGHFLLWNRKARQITGSAPEEVAPEAWPERFGLFRDESGEALGADELPLVRAMRGEAADNVELYLRAPQEVKGRWVQVTARPFQTDDGGPAGGVAVLVDVTEQRALRQRLEAHRRELAEVGRLALGAGIASSAAHQLSQPIGALSGYAGAAVRLHQQGRLGAEQLGDLLTRIESLAVEAGEVLDRLRSLIRRRSRIEVEVDVNQVAETCLDFFNERIERDGVRLERRYADGLPPPIGDPTELSQVVMQLISNALEAMAGLARDERRLIVATDYDAAAGQVRIEVADSGPGLSPERAAHPFEPWQTSKADALGIGLYIAQTIVEAHQGRISADVAETGGALFRVELPAGTKT